MFFSFLSRKLMVNILQTKMCTGRNQGSKVYYLPSGFRSNCAAGGGAPAAGGGARTGTGTGTGTIPAPAPELSASNRL